MAPLSHPGLRLYRDAEAKRRDDYLNDSSLSRLLLRLLVVQAATPAGPGVMLSECLNEKQVAAEQPLVSSDRHKQSSLQFMTRLV